MSQAAAFHLERYTRIDRGGKVGVDGKMDLASSFALAIEKKKRPRCDKLDECLGKVGKIDTIDMSRKGGNACSLMRIPLCLALPNVRGLFYERGSTAPSKFRVPSTARSRTDLFAKTQSSSCHYAAHITARRRPTAICTSKQPSQVEVEATAGVNSRVTLHPSRAGARATGDGRDELSASTCYGLMDTGQ